jgi:hypothetical protein
MCFSLMKEVFERPILFLIQYAVKLFGFHWRHQLPEIQNKIHVEIFCLVPSRTFILKIRKLTSVNAQSS